MTRKEFASETYDHVRNWRDKSRIMRTLTTGRVFAQGELTDEGFENPGNPARASVGAELTRFGRGFYRLFSVLEIGTREGSPAMTDREQAQQLLKLNKEFRKGTKEIHIFNTNGELEQ